MKLFKKFPKTILPLAFVTLGVLCFFQANAALAPDNDCIEVAVLAAHYYGWDVSTVDGFNLWQEMYYYCLEW